MRCRDLTAEITVAAVIERDGQFLLVEEIVRDRRVLNQPAGHVEPGESLLEAVARETLEESAWRFHPTHLIGTYLWTTPETGATTIRFGFAGSVSEHFLERPLDLGILGTHWLSVGQLAAAAQRMRSPMVLQCIEDHVAGKRYPLEAVADLRPAAWVMARPQPMPKSLTG